MYKIDPFFKLASILISALILNACSGASSNSSGSGGTSTGNGSDTGTGTGGGTSSSGTTTTVSVKSNQYIGSHPQATDFYIPSNAEYAIVFLHGGGGNKEKVANDLGIKNDTSTSNYDASDSGKTWMMDNKVMMVFPQGQTISGYNAWTWTNYVMNSGVDDVAFLQDLVASIKADSSLSKINKIYLAGHSNGGMMTNRMWCEYPNTFDAYGAVAGPASKHLDPTLTASATEFPCSPSTIKPYIGMIGNTDKVIQTTGNFSTRYWTINNALHIGNPPTWVDGTPQTFNEQIFFTTKISWKCGASSLPSPTISGQINTYSACGNTMKLIVVNQDTSGNGGDHALETIVYPSTTTLKGNTGLNYRDELFNFFKNQ